jgi:multiple sugar transport system substrate-binding protein
MQMQRGTGNVPVLTWACHLWQHGGDLVDMTRRVATWNSPAGVEALQWWVDLVHKHQVAALQQPANLFQNARAGMWHLPTGTMSVVAGAVGTQFDWACAPLPKGRQLASNVGGHALVVLKTGKFHAEAWRFVHWFTAPQNVVEFNVPSTTLPPWQSAQQQPAWQRYVREQPRIKPFVDMLAYGRPPHKLSTWTEVTTALGQGIEAAVTQQVTPKQALDDAARAAQQFIQAG